MNPNNLPRSVPDGASSVRTAGSMSWLLMVLPYYLRGSIMVTISPFPCDLTVISPPKLSATAIEIGRPKPDPSDCDTCSKRAAAMGI